MLKNLKIGTRIGLGFFLVVVVSALMVAYAIRELRTGSESFRTYRTLARASVLSGRVQANMLTASNAAKGFLNTREETRLEVFRQRFQNARIFALEQQTAIEDPTRRETSRELVGSLESYGIAAEEVFGLMRRRDAILQETLNPQGTRMRQNLTQIMVSAYEDNDSEAAYVAGRALERVLLGRLYLLKFLEDNKDADIERVRAELGSGFEQSFAEMDSAIENPQRQELLQEFSAARDIYVSAFEEIATTIKSRNTLIKQRMEPLERSVADISEQIKLSLKGDQDTLGPQVQERQESTVRAVLIGSAVAIPLAIVIALSIIHAVTNPIAELVETVGNVQASGDLTKRSKIQSTDEVGIMAGALNDFIASLQTQAEVADNVARGILETPIELRSKSDTLGIALRHMTATLKQNAEEAAARDWLRTGRSQTNDAVRGILEKDVLAECVVRSLAKHLKAPCGALYLCDEATGNLHFAAGYGLAAQETEHLELAAGDGLLGQVAYDRKPAVVDQVPADHFKIESGLGQSLPASLILFPFLYNDRLIGIVEFASFEPFEDRDVDFLSSIQENICVAFRAAQSQVELRQLLAHTKQQAIFFRVFKDSTDPIVLEDLVGNVMDLNAAAETAYGWTKQELIGQPIKRIVPEDRQDQAEELRQQCLAGGEIRNAEGLRVSHDGEVYDVLITLSLLRNENDEPIAIASIAKDVTALFKARQAAEEANRAKGEFLANMSLEIRTPMNAIIGMSELALDTELNSEQREYLQTVLSSAEALLMLINDILDFSKIEAGKLDLDSIGFKIRDTLADATHTLAMRAHKKGLELACHVLPSVPEHLIGDPGRLRQVVVNLIGNAIKFTEQGEVVLRVEVEAESDDSALLHFSVSDTGIGIAREVREKVFGAFDQADASTSRRYGGTGLGLAISEQLTALMGGKIWLESELGVGTTFHFTARFEIQDSATIPVAAELDELQGLPVLVVDDNATNLRILDEMLSQWGLKPTTVHSPQEAMKLLEDADGTRPPFKLLLSDVNMPDVDGYEFLKWVRQQPHLKRTTAMLLTSSRTSGDTARAKEIDVAALLTKPIKQSMLLDAIGTAMGAERSILHPVSAEHEQPATIAPLKILLAEDHPPNQKLAVRLLERRGHSVVVANNGLEALAALEKETFDLLLTDIQMPDMDGFAATEAIRQGEVETGGHLPIVAMTAHAMKGDAERCLEAGMDGYVSKPIRRKALYDAIERVMSVAAASNEAASEASDAEAEVDVEEILDKAELREEYEGDEDLLAEMVTSYFELAPGLMDDLRTAVGKGDSAAVTSIAHTLKGGCGNFFAKAAFEAALLLENMGKQGDVSGAEDGLRKLQQELDRLKEALKNSVQT